MHRKRRILEILKKDSWVENKTPNGKGRLSGLAEARRICALRGPYEMGADGEARTLSTDPSYDNRTIASTLKMQIQTVQRAKGDENKVPGYGYGLWCGFRWGPHHTTSHLRSRLESQHQSVPRCAEECGYPLVQSSGWWQTLGVSAGLGAGP